MAVAAVLGVYIGLFLLSTFSLLTGGLASRADAAFVIMTVVIYIAHRIVMSAPGDDNPYADEFGMGWLATVFCLTLPFKAVLTALLVLLFGHAVFIVPACAALVLLGSCFVYREERKSWPDRW